MDQSSLESTLADLHLSAIRYLNYIDSTNEEAWRWVDAGAPGGAVVIADEQTKGRGRSGRRWITPRGSALAFSVILLAPPIHSKLLPRLTGLGAMAVCKALQRKYSLPAQIKWPNDILLNQRKVAGVLVETRWSGLEIKAAIVGIGINIASDSVSEINLPPTELNYPATCVEIEVGHVIDRQEFLHDILGEFIKAFPQLSSADFIQEWEERLAYKDQWVLLSTGNATEDRIEGKMVGLEEDGSLKLMTNPGEIVNIAIGEIHMRAGYHDQLSLPPE